MTIRSCIPIGLAVAGLLVAARQAAAYSTSEIPRIVMNAVRSRDPRVVRAVIVLRSRALLEARSRSLGDLAAAVETAEVMEALDVLAARGLVPDAQTSPGALADYVGRVIALEKEDQERQIERSQRIVLQMARVASVAPYYVRVPPEGVYMLGGIQPPGTEVEIATERSDGTVEVVFPSLRRAFIRKRFLTPLPEVSEADEQDPSEVEVLEDGVLLHQRASHESASLHVVRVRLDPGWRLSIAPVSTGQYDLRAGAGDRVLPVSEIARRTGALAAINGTFFINRPRASHHGKPLGPIIIRGKLVWSYREKRVLRMNRSYVAVTATNRLVIGQTSLTGEEILEGIRRGTFDPARTRGERVVHLLGGLGRLVANGRPNAWRAFAGTQFGPSYYSHYVRRPQTVLGVSADGRTAWLLVQEGRPHSQEPMSLPELARYLVASFRVADAVFLDGGGSSELIVRGRAVTRPEGNGGRRSTSTALLVLGEG